jgi:hypothetical protein
MWYDVGTWQVLCATRFLVKLKANDDGSILALACLALPCLVFALLYSTSDDAA